MKNIEAITLAAPAEQSKRTAFTLAEVLITLGIIGVVAALTMPALITDINERINSHRQANIAYKITQATDKMKAMGLLNGTYATTDQFVDELQKHLKIAKRCDANHIAECWPTKKVITSDGEEFEVKNAKTGKNLNIKSNTSNNVGLILADGASIILTYNQDNQGMDVGEPILANKKSLPVGFGKSKEFAYTTNTTAAIDFVMDVNGSKGRNSETRDNKYYDIRSFKAARFSNGCSGIYADDLGCIMDLGLTYNPVSTCAGSEYEYLDPRYNQTQQNRMWCSTNYWIGAQLACEDIGMQMPDISTLQKLYKEKYLDNYGKGRYWSSTESSYLAGTTLYDGSVSTSCGNKGSCYNKVVCIGN